MNESNEPYDWERHSQENLSRAMAASRTQPKSEDDQLARALRDLLAAPMLSVAGSVPRLSKHIDKLRRSVSPPLERIGDSTGRLGVI